MRTYLPQIVFNPGVGAGSSPLLGTRGQYVTIYRDAAMTEVEVNLQLAEGSVPAPDGRVLVDATSRTPRLQVTGGDEVPTTLYAKPDGSALGTPIFSNAEEALARLEAEIEEFYETASASYIPGRIATGAGIDRTGATSSTAALQALIDEARDAVRAAGGLTVDNAVVIPAGTYLLGATGLVIPTYVKLVLVGTVQFRYTGAGTAVRVTPLDDDPVPVDPFGLKQAHNNAPVFQGGGLIISGAGAPSGDIDLTAGIGLEVGARNATPTAFRPTSRYTIDNVAITGFSIGLKLNTFNHFIGQYRNLHVEINSVNLMVGDGVNNDAGENIHFEHCTFAGASIGLWFLSPGQDATFTACSFDYMDRMLFIDSTGYGNVNFIGGHIEAITAETEAPLYGGITGGVVVASGAVETMQVNFTDTTVLTTSKDPLFRGPVQIGGTVMLRAADAQTANGFFAAAATVDAVRLHNLYPTLHKAVSRDHNLIPDPTFLRPADGLIAPGVNTLVGFDVGYNVAISSLVVLPTGISPEGGKTLRATVGPGDTITIAGAHALPLRSPDDSFVGAILRPLTAVGINVSAKATYARPDGSTVDTPQIGLDTTTIPTGAWAVPPSLLKLNAGGTPIPLGSVVSVKPTFYISNPTGAEIAIDIALLYFGE